MSDNFPKPYQSQFDLRGETLTCYGSDFRNIVEYNFNNQGYRSDFDFDINDSDAIIACLGSSITTGHGLPVSRSFPGLIATKYHKKLWNLGQGCYRSSNQTIVDQIQFLSQSALNIDLYVVQFTHINRQGNKFNSYLELDQTVCVQNFANNLQDITAMLSGKKWCWMLMDYNGSVFPEWIVQHPNKIAIDPDIIDNIPVAGYEHLAPTTTALSALSSHPGPLWHLQTARSIINFVNNESTQTLA